MSAVHSASELCAIAVSLAEEAGSMARHGQLTHKISVTTKSSPTDMVTEYDTASELLITQGLRRLRPDDSIIGEEGGSFVGTSGITWHVDPIDGTTNFLYGQPAWAVSIGATDDSGPIAGAVFVPALQEMFAAARGHGATLNGNPIFHSGQQLLSNALVGTGFSYDSSRRTQHARQVSRMIGEVRDIRRLGAAAVDLCFVACARLDAYYERGLYSWDLVAGQLIATEAGALVTNYRGGPVCPDEVLASTPGIHTALIKLIALTDGEPR